jgi:hypothetical protein
MGKYVNITRKGALADSFIDKCEGLLADSAIEIDQPTKWVENLVCVIDNVHFGAAAYIYNEAELKAFTQPDDRRPRRWFIWGRVVHIALN